MIETIYIARHGFRSNWIDPNWSVLGGIDHPLAAYGETQAQEVAAYFRSLPVSKQPTAIFSSPYYRCLQTALPTASALNLPIYTEHGIAEWYSPAYIPEIDPSWSSIWYPSRTGEDVDQVHARVNGFLELFIPEVERRFSDKHKCILLVSHAATVIALCRGLLAQPDMPLRVGCCSISEFTRKPGAVGIVGAWEPKLLADGSHLKDGSSREWGFEDIQISNGKVINDIGIPGTGYIVDDTCGPQIQRSSL
ncbi:histidine phosphatase superfamily [Pisolithus marmoratus]|nr:histidine phosphatase superfamily [Pisolithus marmoratus]